MKKNLKCIMLIDDNFDDNFFHEREIKKANPQNTVIVNDSGAKALDYLKANRDPHSDLIMLDINMPGMNGWEFLRAYKALDDNLKCEAVVIMLTTSDNADDRAKLAEFPFVTAYITKPLTKEKMDVIRNSYF
ncbi:MAG: response regulator [Bacteroidota bacterium]